MPAQVLKAYTAQYPDPIALKIGDPVTLGKRDPEFPGWIWATSSVSGKSGWVPEEFLTIAGGEARSRRDYLALELTVSEGEIVVLLDELLGWAWAETAQGTRGWIPMDHLARGVTPLDLPL